MAEKFYKSYTGTMEPKQFKLEMSRLGAPTSPMVAKQLEEFGKRLNSGVKNIEIGTIAAEKFEYIPQQHFDEIRRLAKLTDSKVSVHGPLIDLSGFPEQGGGGRWSEDNRKGGELHLFSILQRAFRLGNGENVPVVFHAGHSTAQEFEKGKIVTEYVQSIDKKTGRIRIQEKQEPKEMGFRSIVAVNRDTGEMTKIDYEEKQTPGGKKEIWDPMKKLYNQNQVYWDDKKIEILTRLNETEKIKDKFDEKLKQNSVIEKSGLLNDEKWRNIYFQNQLDLNLKKDFLEDQNTKLSSEYREIYNKFVRLAPEKLLKDSEPIIKNIDTVFKEGQKELIKLKEESIKLQEKAAGYDRRTEEFQTYSKKAFDKEIEFLNANLEQNKVVIQSMQNLESPELWQFAGKFAIEKTSETVASALQKMYSELKRENKQNETPFVALENFFVNSPMSTAKELKEAVNKSRELLSQKLIEKEKLSESEAKKVAEKLICATWDVGHINNLRKAGFEGEELKKKVLAETKEIADVTKHVHITDNFGFHDSHLPPGMGNVPIREIMEQLEKKWAELRATGKLPQEPRAIAEAGGFVSEIGQDPNISIFEYFGSPLYKMSGSPYFWGPEGKGIAHTYTPYNESFIEFPQQHFNIYGSGFTTLPKSVGGQVGGEASRFSGTPNQ